MNEISSESFAETAIGISVTKDENTRKSKPKAVLPESIAFLDELSWNFYWSWNADATELFRDLDPKLWKKSEQNPRQLLREMSELRLWQKANESSFVERLNRLEAEFRDYVSEAPGARSDVTAENPVAYFCAEYGVHNSLPIYSGGLGILSGDHLKSASDMNVPLVAVGLLYRYGYFRQKIAHDGWQEERYLDVFDAERALAPVQDAAGERVFVSAEIEGREVKLQVWRANIGRIPLYLLDSNVPENEEIDRLITGHLYGGGRETRIVQEKVLGIGGLSSQRRPFCLSHPGTRARKDSPK